MRLAAVSFLAALVVAPFAADAAEPPRRWAVTLEGRVTETFSYIQSRREEECLVSRYGTSSRVQRVVSARPTVVTVTRSGAGATYRPARLFRVRLAPSTGRGSWSELMRCLGDPLHKDSGTCERRALPARVIRPAYRWGGPNRIAFRPRPRSAPPLRLCGLEITVPATDAWLSLAPGRVDEELLIAGSRRTVVARAELTRDGEFAPDTSTSGTQKVRVVWTLTFRRLR
jgi:hypothetical protein